MKVDILVTKTSRCEEVTKAMGIVWDSVIPHTDLKEENLKDKKVFSVHALPSEETASARETCFSDPNGMDPLDETNYPDLEMIANHSKGKCSCITIKAYNKAGEDLTFSQCFKCFSSDTVVEEDAAMEPGRKITCRECGHIKELWLPEDFE